MVVLQVFSENIKIKYKSTLLSKATCLLLLTGIISLVVPYIIACKTEGFWIDRINFHEQPKINIRGEYLFVALTNNLSHPIVCSTFVYYTEHLKNLDSCVFFKFRETDNNDDGKYDQLDFKMRINLFNLHITSLAFILPINYELKTVCPFKMQTAIIFQHYFHENTITNVKIIGDLGFHQRGVLNCDEDKYSFYDYPLVNSKSEEGGFEVSDIVENYLERNLSTHLVNVFTTLKGENENVFNIQLSVRYPEHNFYSNAGFWNKVKHAWIQYLAIFVVVNWILNYIKAYMYNKKWLLFFIESPFNKKM